MPVTNRSCRSAFLERQMHMMRNLWMMIEFLAPLSVFGFRFVFFYRCQVQVDDWPRSRPNKAWIERASAEGIGETGFLSHKVVSILAHSLPILPTGCRTVGCQGNHIALAHRVEDSELRYRSTLTRGGLAGMTR